ncbi:hypothetical protein MKQ70_21170 [Chitinophaga sedimenti]|uniref:hypothetical protein n=1 Tax=Chitinophaga sedimenti TaxID=2033606 RepID=UPI0020062944|nr:hypothetical protein [Chitinophaga sedimenti]MCK7557376.1 hypothetical protein [Chitinophaga sedimenti]
MNTTVLFLHSIMRWLIVLAGLWAVLRAWKGVNGKTPFTPADNKAGLFYMIFPDVQLLLGLILYFVTSALTKAAMANMGAAMKDGQLRFWAVEHLTLGLLAIILAHIGRSKVKKAPTDAAKHKAGLIFFGLSFLLVILLAVMVVSKGRGWFPSL